jgi:GNAT superfamily N-acetyltransferase
VEPLTGETDLPASIRAWEESSLNAWPALRTEIYDGWIFRSADGYSRRSNSVNPLYPGRTPIAGRIAAGERFCRENDIPPTFKMTRGCEPPELDDTLATAGYRRESTVSVQRLDLAGWTGLMPAMQIVETPEEGWIRDWTALSRPDSRQAKTIRRVLELIRPPGGFASLERNGKTAACGVGVLREGRLWLFDIVVEEGQRRLGLGRTLVSGLLAWGKQLGARESLLQVVQANAPAKALYAGLGYREAYEYWYRMRD